MERSSVFKWGTRTDNLTHFAIDGGSPAPRTYD